MKRSLTAAVLATCLVALTACGSDDDSAGSGSDGLEKTQVTAGGLPLADYATLYWAEDHGFFDEVGLDVEIVPLQGGPIGVQQVAAGQIDFSFTNTISAAVAQDSGAPITTVVFGSSLAAGEMGIFVEPDSPIQTMEDLDGRSVGVNTTNNMGDVTFNNLAQEEGIEAAPEWVEVPFNEMVNGVLSGSIEAGYVPEPFRSAAIQAGLREVVDLASGPHDGMPAATFITGKTFMQQNPNTVRAFVDAMYAANRDLLEKEDEFRAWLPEVAGVDEETANMMTLPHFDTETDVERLASVTEILQDQGLLPDDFDAAEHTYVADE